jgi:hypothetical protein
MTAGLCSSVKGVQETRLTKYCSCLGICVARIWLTCSYSSCAQLYCIASWTALVPASVAEQHI